MRNATTAGQKRKFTSISCIAAKVLSDANQVIADEQADHRHGERWTFIRKAGAITPTNGGVIAARCPACGAELRLNLDGTCTHCRASVTNGTVDWIVAGVEQAPFVGYPNDSSLAVAAPSIGQGIAALRAADPGFSPDAFRVRVRTAFLALQDAWCKQNLDAGRAFLSPGAYFTWRTQLETLAAEGRRNVMEHSSVQRIDPVLIVHGRVFDDITVRISASAADFEVDKDNRIVFGDRVGASLHGGLDVPALGGRRHDAEAGHAREHLPQLRRARLADSDRRVPLLQGGRDERKIRLGGVANRAGRNVRRGGGAVPGAGRADRTSGGRRHRRGVTQQPALEQLLESTERLELIRGRLRCSQPWPARRYGCAARGCGWLP